MAHADLKRSDKRSFKRKAEQFRANVILAEAKPLHLAREQMIELGLARQKLQACPDVSACVTPPSSPPPRPLAPADLLDLRPHAHPTSTTLHRAVT